MQCKCLLSIVYSPLKGWRVKFCSIART
uniref:Uncharacterized protein n=1 Tax=Arundo donax TaxID=35708 RepID=A0A0A8ZBN3_ARUDO